MVASRARWPAWRFAPGIDAGGEAPEAAARTGFDWPDAEGPRAKIDEELAEVAAAQTEAERTEEIGDLLFAVVNWARHLGSMRRSRSVPPTASSSGASPPWKKPPALPLPASPG